MKNLTFIFALSLPLLFIVSCASDDNNIEVKGKAEFSFSLSEDNSKGRVFSEEEPTEIILSIEDENGILVYDYETVPLLKFNDSYLSQPLDLVVGNYKLTQYLVLNNAGDIIYATPLENSEKAYLVDDPLPILFSVSKDQTTKVVPEVLSTQDATPEDFGYVSAGFSVVDTFDFLIGISVYNSTTDNMELTDGSISILSGGTPILDDFLTATTNAITLREDNNDFVITIEKTGYQTYIQSFSNDSLKSHFETPLLISLEPSNVNLNTISARYQSSFVLKPDGTLWATGRNDFGSLGDGTNTHRNTFTQVLSDVLSVENGLAIKTDGSLWATGYNGQGRLGDGTNTDKNSFIHVLTDVSMAYDGHTHSLALKADGTLWATGFNGWGQLGDATNIDKNTYTQILTDVVAISGNQNTFAVKSDGSLWATGNNFQGKLGDGTNIHRNTFVQVLADVSSVSAGENHTIALKTDGTLWATGYNYSGQLGDGTNISRNTFTQVLTDVSAISAGAFHNLILKSDGTLWATGDNVYGKLGDGTNTDRNTYVQIMSDVSDISGGKSHSLIRKSDGTVWVTGSNSYGELGDGTNNNTNVFVQISL